MKVRLSIIIPVYNAEKYLRQCLGSILSQGMEEMEIICIDDHSTDGSLEILKEHQKQDDRICVIQNMDNLGAGKCRNLGIDAAHGEYLLFMDADDWLFEGSIERVYQTARQFGADVLRCRALDMDDQTRENIISVHNGLKKVPFFLFDRAIRFPAFYWIFPKVCVAPWGGLVKRQFLLEKGIHFNDLVCVNDRSFFWETVLNAEKIVFTQFFLVHYRTNIGSSLVGSRIKNFDCHFESYQLVNSLCTELPPKIRRCVLNGELLDIANWLEKSKGTDLESEVCKMTRQFIETINRSYWKRSIKKTKWYQRIYRSL